MNPSCYSKGTKFHIICIYVHVLFVNLLDCLFSSLYLGIYVFFRYQIKQCSQICLSCFFFSNIGYLFYPFIFYHKVRSYTHFRSALCFSFFSKIVLAFLLYIQSEYVHMCICRHVLYIFCYSKSCSLNLKFLLKKTN